jgi:predicted DNA-binding transcriptional regulator AlpA
MALQAMARAMPRKTEDAESLELTVNNRERLLMVSEAADFLRLSQSWLAKSRMRGDGPPFVKIGRAIRYRESSLVQWLKSNQRRSTSER